MTDFTQVAARPVSLDPYLGGGLTVTGTVKRPDGTPLHQRVQLINEPTGIVVRETWSDPLTGAYQFKDVAARFRHTVVTFDHTGAFAAVVADNIAST